MQTETLETPADPGLLPPLGSSSNDQPTTSPFTSSLASLPRSEVPWLWPNRFPLGQISLLVSQPGAGKSLLSMDIAARVSAGAPWPDGTESPRGSVLLLPREDDVNQVIRPRLEAHGADLNKIHILDCIREEAKMTPEPGLYFDLNRPRDLEGALFNHTDCRLIILDPVAAFFCNADLRHDKQIRNLLHPLFHLATRTNAAILLIHHLAKRPTRHADQSILGGSAFAALSRNVWHLIADPHEETRRLLVPGKSNLSARAQALAFNITTDPTINTAKIVWENTLTNETADEALTRYYAAKSGPEPLSRIAAQSWLTDFLKPGPQNVSTIRRESHRAGVAWSTLQRAADQLSILRRRLSNIDWTWELPTHT